MSTATRRVANREELARTRKIVLGDDITVIRHSDVVEWVTSENRSVKDAAEHFGVNQNIIRDALRQKGIRGRQQTVWQKPSPDPASDGDVS